MPITPARRRRILAVLVAAGTVAAVAPAAHADSIAYVKDGDVWLSTGDGTRQFRVTDRGGYSDVSQADDGTMIALSGVRLHRLDRLGTVLADFATPVSDTRPAGSRTFYGPYDPAVSPDGTKVAYAWYYATRSQTPTCFPPECVTAINEGGTGYSHSDRETAWDEPGFAKHSGWRNPSWVDDQTTVLSDPTHLPNHDVVVDRPGERGSSGFLVKGWFSDTAGGNPHTGGGEVTRARDKAAFVTGEGDSALSLYRVGSFPTTFKDGEAPPSTRPEICYRYGTPAGGRFGTPTFSPDGSRFASATGAGIEVGAVPSFAAGCTTDGASPTLQLLIPGGTQPDWGPAGVPSGRPSVGGGAPSVPVPTTSTAGGGVPGSATTSGSASPSTAGPRRQPRMAVARGSASLARGFTVVVTGARPSAAIRLSVRQGSRVVARGDGRSDRAGRARVRVRFSPAAKRRLGHGRRIRLTVRGVGQPIVVTLKG